VKISNEHVQQILQAGGVKPVARVDRAARTQASAPGDAATLSTASQEISKAMGLLARTPDVRADKVAELKARIQSGNYDFSGESIAQAILSGRNQDVDF